MTVKCTFCNDTKQEPGTPGPCVWCECAPENQGNNVVQRHTIAHLRYAGGEEHNVKYVSEVDYDRVVVELAERDHQLGLLGQLLGEILVAAGHISPGFGLSGPQLLQFGTELRDSLSAADPGEVERLRAELAGTIAESERRRNCCADLIEERDTLRAQLAERDELLKRVHQADALSHNCPLWKDIDAAQSASAEPSAPTGFDYPDALRLLSADHCKECGHPDCNGQCYGDDMMGDS